MTMRQASTDPAGTRRAGGLRAALPMLWLGLGATVLTMLAVVLDEAAIGSIADRTEQVYRGSPVAAPDAGSFVVTYLLTVGAAGVLGWLWAAWGASRQRRWTRPVSTVLLVLGVAFAVLGLTAAEYGSMLVPTWLGVLGLLPSVVGLAAVVRMWRS